LLHDKTRNLFWFRGLALFILLANIILHFLLLKMEIWNPMSLLSILLFLALIPFLKKNKHYHSQIWQNESIKKALNKISSTSQFYPDNHIPESEFIRSSLYNNVEFQYSGSHLFQDEALNIRISNIRISQEISSQHPPIFDGVFAKISIQSEAKHNFIMKPAYSYKNQYLPEIFKKLFQRYIPEDFSTITTSNEKFNAVFDVYAQDKEGKLSPRLMLQILKLKDQLMEIMQKEKESGKYIVFASHSLLNNSPLEISIVKNNVFLGIRNMKLFNPSLVGNIKESTNKSIEIIQMISHIGRLN